MSKDAKPTQLLRFTGPVRRSPAIATWMRAQPADLGAIARRWFAVMRRSGSDVREVVHDGHPTACVGDAGFAYVNAFRAHVNVGFFRGAELPDPAGLLEGTGKFMRHVKLRPGVAVNAGALTKLIGTAYVDMKGRVQAENASGAWVGSQSARISGKSHAKARRRPKENLGWLAASRETDTLPVREQL